MRKSDRRTSRPIQALLAAGLGAMLVMAAPALAADTLHFGITTETLTVDPATLDPAAFDAIFPRPPASGPAAVLNGNTTATLGILWAGEDPGAERDIQVVIDSDGSGTLDPFDWFDPSHPWNRPDNGTPRNPDDDPVSWTYTYPPDYPDEALRGTTLTMTWDSGCECVQGFPFDTFEWWWVEAGHDQTRTVTLPAGVAATYTWDGRSVEWGLFPDGDYPVGVWADLDEDGRFADQERLYTTTIRIETITITGRLVDDAGDPVAGAGISAFSEVGYAVATSDADGRFRLTGLPPGATYWVQITASGMVAKGPISVAAPDEATTVDVKTIRMTRAVDITGTVALDRNANGVTGEPADAFSPYTDRWGWEVTELSVELNAWSLRGDGWGAGTAVFTPGETTADFVVSVPPPDGEAVYELETSADGFAASPVRVTVGEAGGNAGEIVLTRAGAVVGTVRLPVPVTDYTEINARAVDEIQPSARYYGWGEIDPYHQPARCEDPAYDDIEACEAAGAVWAPETVSDKPVPTDTGTFRFEGLPAGTYRIEVQVAGFLPATRDGVRVVRGAEGKIGEIVLERGSVLSGTLTVLGDTTGLSVGGAAGEADLPVWVEAWAPETGDSQGTSLMVPRGVDQHVDFEIGGLSPGRYEMLAYLAEGYDVADDAGKSPVLVDLREATARQDVYLKPYEGRVTGKITGQGVTIDLNRVVVDVRRPWDYIEPQRATVSNGGIDPATGEYVVSGLGTGDYVVRAGMYLETDGDKQVDPAVGIRAERISVENDADRPTVLDIPLGPGYSISGRVRLAAGEDHWHDFGDGEGGAPDGRKNTDPPYDETITVADLDGAAVQAVPMEALLMGDAEGDVRQGTLTAKAGAAVYRIDGLGPGAYVVVPPPTSPRIDALTGSEFPDLASEVLSGLTDDRHWAVASRQVVLTGESSMTGVDFTLEPGHTVTVTVILPEVQTVIDPETDAWELTGYLSLEAPGGEVSGQGRPLFKADFDGSDQYTVSFSHVAEGDQLLYFWSDRYVPAAMPLTVSQDTAAEVSVEAGAGLTGLLVDAETGAPVTAADGVTVFCEALPYVDGSYRETRDDEWSRSYIEKEADDGTGASARQTPGRFHLTALPSGHTYLVGVTATHGRKTGGAKNYVGRVISGVDVPDGATGEIDLGTLALSPGTTVTGRLTNADGEPVPNVTVIAFPTDPNDGTEDVSGTSDRDGYYTIYGIDPEIEYYDLIAARRPWLFEDWGRKVEWGEERRYNLSPARIDPETGRTAGADVTLTRATAGISGTVTVPENARFMLPFVTDDGTEYPATYVLLRKKGVVYRDMLEGIEGFTTPAPEGARTAQYQMDHVAPGTYRVVFMNYGLPRAAVDNVQLAPGEQKVINATWDNDFYRIYGTLALDDGGRPAEADVSGVVCVNLADRSVIFGRLRQEADQTYSGYEVAGLPAADPHQLIFYRNADMEGVSEVFAVGDPFTTGTADRRYDAVITRRLAPILFLRAIRDEASAETLQVTIFSTKYLADESVSVVETAPTLETADGAIYLESGSGVLSDVSLSPDRRRITARYTPSTGDGRVTLAVAVHYGNDDTTAIQRLGFDADATLVNSDLIDRFTAQRLSLGAGDATRLQIPAGAMAADDDNLILAVTRTSADAALGLPEGVTPASDHYAVAITGIETGAAPTFREPVTVQIAYDPAGIETPDWLHVYRKDGETWQRETAGRDLDPVNGTVTVETDGLSEFVVGYGQPPAEEPPTSAAVTVGEGDTSDCFIHVAGTPGWTTTGGLLALLMVGIGAARSSTMICGSRPVGTPTTLTPRSSGRGMKPTRFNISAPAPRTSPETGQTTWTTTPAWPRWKTPSPTGRSTRARRPPT